MKAIRHEEVKTMMTGSGVRSQGGFSLIEILVVMVLLAFIATLVVPNLMGKTQKAQYDAAKLHIDRLSMAVENYFLDNGAAPERLEDLVNAPANAPNWTGPYVKGQILKDPWGEPYQYRSPGEHGEFDIFSYGADKAPGGDGRNADITSWDQGS